MIDQLLKDQGIVRNKLKILTTINNAKFFIELRKEEGSFLKFIWNYVNHRPLQNNFEHPKLQPLQNKTCRTDQ